METNISESKYMKLRKTVRHNNNQNTEILCTHQENQTERQNTV